MLARQKHVPSQSTNPFACTLWLFVELPLEAQQRYFSYRAILAAIVSQNSFVLVFVGVSHNYRAIRCKMGYRTNVSL